MGRYINTIVTRYSGPIFRSSGLCLDKHELMPDSQDADSAFLQGRSLGKLTRQRLTAALLPDESSRELPITWPPLILWAVHAYSYTGSYDTNSYLQYPMISLPEKQTRITKAG